MTTVNIACRFATSLRTRRGMTAAEIKRQLKAGSWRVWALTVRPPLSARELAMASLPRRACYKFSGLNCHACKFVISSIEKKKVTCDSIVMTWVDDGTVRTPYVGRLKQLLLHVPPWVNAGTSAEQMEQAVQIADVEWFDVLGYNATLYNSPIVSRSTKAQPDGEFCMCEDLAPVALSLVPYIGTAVPASRAWQVLTRDVTVFKADIDTCLPELN